ncbi:tRNA (guanosine(37)-N1)-methyltransferase TrmD [Candidatus Erwinia haradaeae]|uniref:tRNA (guanine-N(1)-)-methyltransferase n=1 Tax=Candidatus Erwinia haradaeae TaxID=1922217 RepID=A0A451D962_9GAMM|nr:tRNA (guanosine(37)-N1)-methyltransferase TrmD [Candidatus Erwinia haradaeae]VFP82762.1 tRNA (guanine-N(1)-)-methyltransferase [Candidatus Erwinia haradaeae]
MWIGVISLFPQMFCAITNHGVTRRAIQNGLIKLHIWNPRDFTCDKHRTVDGHTYGGGPGMLMMLQPLRDAIRAAQNASGVHHKVIYLSPQGRTLDHNGVSELAKNLNLTLVCGRYEGIDERLIQNDIDEEWSIGDYVLSGGELPAMILIDAISRLLPGVLGKHDSAMQDSFCNGLLDYPHYTQPEELEGAQVPSVLLSGHHEKIRRWRLKQSIGRTWLRRPELLKKLFLTEEQKILLTEFQAENHNINQLSKD